jgi:hypothetical protein
MTQHQIDKTYNGIPDSEEEKDAKNYTLLRTGNHPLGNNINDEALEITRPLTNHQTTFTRVSPEKEDSSGPILSGGSAAAIEVSHPTPVPTGPTWDSAREFVLHRPCSNNLVVVNPYLRNPSQRTHVNLMEGGSPHRPIGALPNAMGERIERGNTMTVETMMIPVIPSRHF